MKEYERESLEFDGKHPWRDESLLHELHVEEGLTFREIADLWDCSKRSIWKWCKKHDIDTHNEGKRAVKELHDEEFIKEEYVEKGNSTYEIARELGCDRSTVQLWVKKFGYSVGVDDPVPELQDEEWLKEKYVEEKLTVYEIADLIDCGSTTVTKWVNRYDLPKNPRGNNHPRYNPKSPDKHLYGQTWHTQRKKRLEKDNYQCVVCSRSQEDHIAEYGRGLTVHHVVPKEEFRDDDGILNESEAHDLSNLMTVCEPCHGKWEGIPLHPDTATSD